MDNIRKTLENTGFSRVLRLFLKFCKKQITVPSVLQLLEPEPLGLNPQKWLTYWLFSCFPLAALFNFILVLRSFFFVQLFNYFSTPDTRLVIIFVKVFIIFVGFILRRLTKTSLRKQPSIRHSLLLWISPIHFPSSLLIHVCIYQLLWNNEHVPWAAEQPLG